MRIYINTPTKVTSFDVDLESFYQSCMVHFLMFSGMSPELCLWYFCELETFNWLLGFPSYSNNMNVCLVINESVLHTGGVRGPRTRYLRKPLAPRGSRGSRKSFMLEERHYRHWRWRLQMEWSSAPAGLQVLQATAGNWDNTLHDRILTSITLGAWLRSNLEIK